MSTRKIHLNGSISLKKIRAPISITGALFILMVSLGASFEVPSTHEYLGMPDHTAYQDSVMKKGLEAPTLISPNGIAGTKTPMFIWGTVKGASSYIIRLKYPISGTISTKALNADDVTVGSRCEWPSQFPALDFGSYVWWVEAKEDSIVGPRSDPMRFEITGKVPDRSIPGTPSGLTSTQRPIFIWSAANGATRYTLEVDLAGTNHGFVFSEDLPAEDVTVGPKCRFISPMPLSGDLFWRIQAHNDFGSGNVSPDRYFSVVCPANNATSMNKEKSTLFSRAKKLYNLYAGECQQCG